MLFSFQQVEEGKDNTFIIYIANGFTKNIFSECCILDLILFGSFASLTLSGSIIELGGNFSGLSGRLGKTSRMY